jgi:hypothetical protein
MYWQHRCAPNQPKKTPRVARCSVSGDERRTLRGAVTASPLALHKNLRAEMSHVMLFSSS